MNNPRVYKNKSQYFYGVITTHYGEYEENDRFVFEVPLRLSQKEVELRIAAGFRCAYWPDKDGLYWFDGYAHNGVEGVRELTPEAFKIMKEYLPAYGFPRKAVVASITVDEGNTSGAVTLMSNKEFPWELNDQNYPVLKGYGPDESQCEYLITEEIMGYLLLNDLRSKGEEEDDE